MAYVDGFVLPLPRKNLAAYRRIARTAGKIWRELGALMDPAAMPFDVKRMVVGGFKILVDL